MLVLKRKPEESILIGDRITIKVLGIEEGQVKLGVEAPPEVRIMRQELLKPRREPFLNRHPMMALVLPFLIGFILLAIGHPSRGATVGGTIKDRTGTLTQTNVTIITMVKQRTIIDGSFIYPGWNVTTWSDTNGIWSTPLVAGDYQVLYGNTGKDHFLISVPSGAGTYDVTDIATNAMAYTFTTNPNFVNVVGDTMTGNLNWNTNGDHAGLILKALTTTDRDALSATNGMLIYNLTDGAAQIYQSDAWVAWGSGGGGGGGGLTTNQNQFAGAPLSIKDGASVTNLDHYATFTSNGDTILAGDVSVTALSPLRVIVTDGTSGLSASSITTTLLNYLAGLVEPLTTSLANLQGATNGLAADILSASNKVEVVAGTGGITVTPSGSGGVMTFTVDDDTTGLTTNQNQFAGAPLSIKDGAPVTNITAHGTFTLNDVTASRVLVTDGSSGVTASSVTSTELGHVSGVTSPIQTQFLGTSNRVEVVAGTGGITVTPSGSGGVMTYTVNDDDAGAGGTTPTNAVVLLNQLGASTYYVPTADTDAARGLALSNAIASASSGAAIKLGAGGFDLGAVAGVALTNRTLTIQGVGMLASVIYGDIGGAFFDVQDNANLFLDSLSLTNANIFGFGINNDHFVELRNVRVRALADTIGTADPDGRGAEYYAYNSEFIGYWDNVSIFATNSTFHGYDCYIEAADPSTNDRAGISVTAPGAVAYMHGGRINMTSINTSFNGYAVNSLNGTVNLYGTEITLAGVANEYAFNPSTSGTINAHAVSGVGDSATGTGTLNRGNLVTTNHNISTGTNWISQVADLGEPDAADILPILDNSTAQRGKVTVSNLLLSTSNRVEVVAGTGGITVTPSGSGGVMTFTIDDDDAGPGGGGLTTNQNQFAGAPLSIKDGAPVTNITAHGTFTLNDVTASRVLVTDGSSGVTASAITSTELGYLDAATDNIQDQLNNHQLYIDAGAMVPESTDGATATTEETTDPAIVRTFDFYAFNDSSTNGVQFKFSLPENWDLSTVKFKLQHSSTNTSASQTNVFEIQAAALNSGDSITNVSWGTAITITNHISSSNTVLRTLATPALTIGNTPAAGDLLWFRIRRLSAHVDDVLGGDARLLGAWLQYSTDGNAIAPW